MLRSRFVLGLAAALCVISGSTTASAGGILNGLFLQNEMRPVYAPAEDSADPGYGVLQTSHECLGGWTSPSACGECQPCGDCLHCGDCSNCRTHWSRWWEHVKCRFKRCRWENGYETCYPVCPPPCGPNYGYHPTCWRRLMIDHPCPPAVPNVFATPEPVPPGTPQFPPYAPAPGDMIAPPAPTDQTAPPAPYGELP